MTLCLQCTKPTPNPKFCSRSCSATYTNHKQPKRKLNRICSKCTEVVKSYKHSLCKSHHEEHLLQKTQKAQNVSLAEYWCRRSLEHLPPSSKNVHIRNLCRTQHKHLTKLPCGVCGYTKHVELCHLKPLSSFPPTATVAEVNSSTNIIQLCPNCHWEYDAGLLKLNV